MSILSLLLYFNISRLRFISLHRKTHTQIYPELFTLLVVLLFPSVWRNSPNFKAFEGTSILAY